MSSASRHRCYPATCRDAGTPSGFGLGSRRHPRTFLFALATLLATTSGCTSALTSTYLRGMPWDLPEHAAERQDTAESADDDQSTTDAPPLDADGTADDDRRSAAIDEAVSRLSRLGTLDPVAEATLAATLRNTQPEDWPVVIEEFAAVLSEVASQGDAAAAGDTSPRADAASPGSGSDDGTTADQPAPATSAATVVTTTAHTVAKADLEAATPATAPEPDSAGVESQAPNAASIAVADTVTTDEPRADDTATDSVSDVNNGVEPGLRIGNACFASRVQAWGVVDRFPADRFRAGREVIVYFELDALTTQATAAGHTTCIDTVLRLVDATGDTLHEWNFEPLAETCAGRRRDYFARYVVRLPAELPPGACRLDVLVTDTLAGTRAESTLPLEIVATAVPGEG
jgi:hypothetical protein